MFELHNKSVLHNHGDGGIEKHVNRASRLVNTNRCTNYYNYSFYDRKLSECMLKPHLPASFVIAGNGTVSSLSFLFC